MKSDGPRAAAIAAVVQRLAVLLAGGIAPGAAWGYLEVDELTSRIASMCLGGSPVPDAIVAASTAESRSDQLAWRGLATAWAVATDVGSPLAPTLRDFADSLRDLGQAQREITVALAAPTATARLVLALPFVGV
ncbi:MAG TPA: hypothetical protein VK537_02355, partial [Galbitalea sp.]|nr:hypothetical protein [Galbitalea sp.]